MWRADAWLSGTASAAVCRPGPAPADLAGQLKPALFCSPEASGQKASTTDDRHINMPAGAAPAAGVLLHRWAAAGVADARIVTAFH